MNKARQLLTKRPQSQEREQKLLFGLVEHYIQTGKAVGSHTLKESGFEHLSSATIRNYFAKLEEKGFLIQAHSSGGRIPTHLAYKVYATHLLKEPLMPSEPPLQALASFDSSEVISFLHESADWISETSGCAALLSSLKFDHDAVIDIKLVLLDSSRCLCIVITNFGVIQTEVLQLPETFPLTGIKKIEDYLHLRLSGAPSHIDRLDPKEEFFGQKIFSEIMLRYVVGYANFTDEEIYRTGFSSLLNYPEFQDAASLACGLSLFERRELLRSMMQETLKKKELLFWIGSDLENCLPGFNCSLLMIPYFIHQKPAGVVGLLGPARMPYKDLFRLMHHFSSTLSEKLTATLYKFQISFREPKQAGPFLPKEEELWIQQNQPRLLT